MIRHRIAVPALVGVLVTVVAGAVLALLPEPWTFSMDTGGVFLPQTLLAFRAWFAGRVPEWSDMLWGGFPLIGDPTTAALYPLYIVPYLATLTDPLRFYDVAFALHLGIFAAGTVALMRRLGASTGAAVFGGVLAALAPHAHSAAFAYGAVFASQCWWPWAFLAAETLVRPATPLLGGAMALGWVALALQVLAGVPEQATYCAVPVTCWILFRASPLGIGQRIARVALLGAGAVALCAPQLFATAMILPWTHRAGVPEKYDFGYLWPEQAVRLLVVGSGAVAGLPWFVGIPALLLAIAAIARRRPAAFVLAGIAFAALLLALGPSVGLYELVHHLPPISYFRNPAKIYAVTEYSIMWLAVLGLDSLRRAASARTRVVALLLVGALVAERAIHLREEALAFEKLRVSDRISPARVARLARLPGMQQAEATAPPPVLFDYQGPFGGDYTRSLGALVNVSSLHAGSVALLGANQFQLLSRPSAGALDVFGVRFVLASSEQCETLSRKLRWRVIELTPEDCVLENPAGTSRYAMLPDFDVVTDRNELVELASRRPRPVAVLASPDLPRPTGRGGLTLQAYRPGHAWLLVVAGGPQLVLVRESFAPGWQASVDDKPVTPYPAAGIFFAVPVPPGVHRVELQYHARGLRPGLTLAAGWIVLAAVAITWRRRQRRVAAAQTTSASSAIEPTPMPMRPNSGR